MKHLLNWPAMLALAGAAVATGAAAAPGKELLGVACQSPPPMHCAIGGCSLEQLGYPGNATDPKTGRKFFLDYPCDLKPGEKVVFILSLHGAGAIGEWQRHYFPAMGPQGEVSPGRRHPVGRHDQAAAHVAGRCGRRAPAEHRRPGDRRDG